MNNKFDGKKVFVAGGTGGIGKAISKSFLESGAKVFLSGRDLNKLKTTITELDNEFKGKISGSVIEYIETNNVSKLINEANDFLNGIDIFVSAIGSGKFKKTGLLKKEEWNEILDQNFFSATLMVETLFPILKQGNNPNIVLIGSIAAFERMSAPVGYGVSKAALHAYVRLMSEEMASDNVRINIVHPGNIFFENGRWDEIKKDNPKATEDYINKYVPQKRFGSPKDISETVLFLASNEALYITGSYLSVDGGQHLSF